ncbi:cupin domain-containing protein [Nocardia sp. 2YAB30]|uniref:cupin domain-containing protein n=1 Tax=unclassified Nocardia TaxID=2637762 RepID=UPI003F98FE06
MSEDTVIPPVRRIVTGHDENGRSIIVSAGDCPNTFVSEDIPGFGASVAWITGPGDISNADNEDAATAVTQVPMYPKVGGSIFRIATFPPDAAYSDQTAKTMFSEFGGEHGRAAAEEGSRHFWFHRTESLDYGIVLDGEIWLMTDEGECLMKPGDVVVQRGTSHSWSNRSDKLCRMAFILLGSLPLFDEGQL